MESCELCGRKDRTATINDLKGLNWLSPDDLWICEQCLETKRRAVPIRF